MKYFNLVLLFLMVSCHSKQSEPSNSVNGIDSIQIIKNHETEMNSLNSLDSLISSENLKRNLKEWYQYQLHENPKFSPDSFVVSENKPLDLVSESYDFSKRFSKVYHSILSYSPDRTQILDLFSNQIKLEKLDNGTYGGLYTIFVDPFLIIPSRKDRLRLLFYETSDQFHDSYWLNNNILIITGTTSSKKPNDYTRYYKIWIIDIEHKIFRSYINTVSTGNYHVDDYIINSKMKAYQVWFDDI